MPIWCWWCSTPRSRPDKTDRELLQQVAERAAVAVLNKSDLASASAARRRADGGVPAVRTSALSGEGIAELRQQILRHVHGDAGPQQETGMLTNLRQQEQVTRTLAALDAAAVSVRANTPHEMILLDLYNALRALDEITGATTADDILNLIFGTFCIGK